MGFYLYFGNETLVVLDLWNLLLKLSFEVLLYLVFLVDGKFRPNHVAINICNNNNKNCSFD